VGVLLAVLSNWLMTPIVSRQPRYLFLVGIIPALLVLWIRRAVPEPAEWHKAKAQTKPPPLGDLFRGTVGKTTLLVIAVCGLSLTAHWAFMFWHQTQLKSLPDVLNLPITEKNQLGSKALYAVMVASIIGNFAAAAVAKLIGYRRAIAFLCFGYFVATTATYSVARPYSQLLTWLWLPGFFQGVFALFTMYLPPLFPTLLRTTGAGFCYNIGRIISAAGVVLFGYFSTVAPGHTTALVADHRRTLLYAGFLFIPAGLFALLLPELRDKPQPVGQPLE
jgi:MFS family permease